MRYRTKTAAILGAIVVLAIAGPGCGGGDSSGQGGSGASSNGGNGGEGGAGAQGGQGGTGAQGGSGGAGGSGGSGGSGGGMSGDNGVQATDFVSTGGTLKSANYRMVFSLGQSTQNQGKTTSANYKMQGGLIGAVAGSSQ